MFQAMVGTGMASAVVFAQVLTGSAQTPSPGQTPPTPSTVTTSPTPTPTPAHTPTPTTTPTTTPTPTPAPTPTRPAVVSPAARPLTLDPPPSSVWEDRPVRLSGRLSNGASWSVSLWRQVGTGWTRIGYVKATEGEFAVSVTPTAPGTWTVKAVLGAAPTDPIQSEVRTFTVANRTIAITKPAAAYTALTGVTLSGKVTPAEAGRTVILDWIYQGAWRGFASGTTDATGTFRIRVPDNFPYQWKIRARTSESPATAVEYSSSVQFDVKAYLWPQVSTVTASDIPSTYRSGCPVGPSKLRRLVLTHWGFDKKLHRGELIVRDAAVSDQIAVWNAAIINRFYVRGMHRVDVYGGSDVRSMEADNTSAFNCRQVTGDPYSLSPHSYGYATDVNTVENPYYAANGVWYPKNGLSYRNRSIVRMGMLFSGSTPTRVFNSRGYLWGADWSRPDYQHFEPR